MSIEALTWCKYQDCPTPTSKLVLFVLAYYADERHSCYPSEKTLAKICGISDRQVRTHLKKLQDMGLLTIVTRHGTSNRYVLRVDAGVHRGVEADFRPRVEADFRRVRKRTSANTKDIQNNRSEGNLNELAG